MTLIYLLNQEDKQVNKVAHRLQVIDLEQLLIKLRK